MACAVPGPVLDPEDTAASESPPLPGSQAGGGQKQCRSRGQALLTATGTLQPGGELRTPCSQWWSLCGCIRPERREGAAGAGHAAEWGPGLVWRAVRVKAVEGGSRAGSEQQGGWGVSVQLKGDGATDCKERPLGCLAQNDRWKALPFDRDLSWFVTLHNS